MLTPTNTPISSFTGPTNTPTPGSFVSEDTELDLLATGIEVTQGIQDLQNQIPLVENRWTAVRVYVEAGGAGAPMPNVTGLLGGWRNGQFLGTRQPANGPITAPPDGGDRINLDDSLYFYLPMSWRSGDVLLKAVVFQSIPATMQFELDDENNYVQDNVSFSPVDTYYVRLVPYHLHQDGDPGNPETTLVYEGNEDVINHVMLDMFRYLPISSLIYDPGLSFPIVLWPDTDDEAIIELDGPLYPSGHFLGEEWDLSDTGDWSAANASLASLKNLSADPWGAWFWYGMIPEFQNTGSYTGWATSGVASGRVGWEFSPTSPWWLRFGITVAHEIAHVIMPGADHIKCKSETAEAGGGALDTDYPYQFPACSMAAVDPEGFYGFDVYSPLWPWHVSGPTVISNDPAESQPNRGFPMMGYQRHHWADPYDYCKLLDALGVACDKNIVKGLDGPDFVSANPGADGHGHVHAPSGTTEMLLGQAEGAYLLVQATIDGVPGDAGAIAKLIPSRTAPAGAVSRSTERVAAMAASSEPAGELVLFGGDGEELARYPLANIYPVQHEDESLPTASMSFSEWFPLPAGAAKAELQAEGRVLDSRTASVNPPVVHLTSPNGGPVDAPVEIAWEASDPDGDPLQFDVLYSADDGENWMAIISGVTGDRVRLETLLPLSGSDAGRFKVVVSDGFHSAEDVSDEAVRVPDVAPSAAILGPSDGATYRAGETVFFFGTAFDQEELGLPGGSLSWESDRDGSLGTGSEVMTEGLSTGTHRITLTARDSAGNETQRQVTIRVGSEGEARTPLDDEAVSEGRQLLQGASAGDLAVDDSSVTTWLIAGGVAAALVAVSTGLMLFTRRRRIAG